MPITSDEAAMIRFELMAMSARLKELVARCQSVGIPQYGRKRPRFLGMVSSAYCLETQAKLLTEVFTLPEFAGNPQTEKLYPEGYEPPDGSLLPAYGADAWHIIDTFVPGKLTQAQRNMLCGVLAGWMGQRVDDALTEKPLPKNGTGRRRQ